MNILFWMSTGFQTTSRHLLISILEALSNAGHEITVLKKKDDNELKEFPDELANSSIKYISIPFKASSKNKLIARYVKDIEYILKCKKYLNSYYDAVFVQSSNVAGLVFRMLQKKQLHAIKTFNVQDTFPENAVFCGTLKKRGLSYKVLKRIQRNAYDFADHIITISEDMKELLIEEYEVPPEKVVVVYNWSYKDEVYDASSFDTEAMSQIYKQGAFNVVYAGNIGVMQNVDVVVEAANHLKEHKDIWFYIIGNGVCKDRLQAKASKYGLDNITFLPMLPSELAPSIYGLADVNIIPLKNNVYKTALPSKTATCLACQRPIIFAIGKDSKFGEILHKETGCPLVDCDDSEGLANAIISIRNCSVTCNTIGVFRKYCARKENSKRYASIITE